MLLGALCSLVATIISSLDMVMVRSAVGGNGALTGALTVPGNVAVMLPGAAVVCCAVGGVVTVPTAPGKAGGCLPEAGTALVPASALGAAGAGEGEVAGFTPFVPVLPVACIKQQHSQYARQDLNDVKHVLHTQHMSLAPRHDMAGNQSLLSQLLWLAFVTAPYVYAASKCH